MVKITIVNVVATANLHQKLDLYELGKLREISHDPEIYRGLAAYFKTPLMEGKVSIFSSGKMISVGTTSEKKAADELEWAKQFLVENNFVKQTTLRPKIRNVVVTVDFAQEIDLEKLHQRHRIVYEPEQFPGAILRIERLPRSTALIFASGKVVIAGLQGSNQIEQAMQELLNVIGIR